MTLSRRPNILLIMSDNQSAGTLGCYGNQEIRTPHLDRLATGGVRFNQAFCVNAMCSPCRASVLTGLMPSQHGIHNWLMNQRMAQWPAGSSAISEFPNLPTLLQEAGYNTALIGKWHLGPVGDNVPGFNHAVAMPHGHTVDFYDNQVMHGSEMRRVREHSVEHFTRETTAFLESQANADQPFFAFVPLNGPYGHWPAIQGRAANPFASWYDDCPMDSVPREGLDSRVLDRFAQRVQSSGGEVLDQYRGPMLLPNDVDSLKNYYSQISLIDDAVGQMQAALTASGMGDNTLIIYTADHGFSLGHNGVWGHGQASWPSSLHRASTHIPLIVGGDVAGLSQGSVADGLISQIDLFPTLLSLAGVAHPGGRISDARDFSAVLTDPAKVVRDHVLIEQEETRALRSSDWLLEACYQGHADYDLPNRLFDLRADPEERFNVAHDHPEQFTNQRQALAQAFDALLGQDRRFDLWSGGRSKSHLGHEPLWA